ncbi:MAG: hypothetical protein KDA99_02065, partial [Planctomycetales bacterium]|nr:hypothetical protein [Planctomycetales bacterium]
MTREATGATCHGMPIQGMDDRLQRIGFALRELHATAREIGPVKSIRHHLSELVRPAPDAVVRALPEYSALIRKAVTVLESRSAVDDQIPCVPLHRDFHLRQLLDDGQ